MPWKDEWATVQADMDRDGLDERSRKTITRNFFLKTVAPATGGRKSKEAEGFIDNYIAKAPKAKAEFGGGTQALAEGFNRNLTGQALQAVRRGVTGEKTKPVFIKEERNIIQPGFASVASEALTGTAGELLLDPIGRAIDAVTLGAGSKLVKGGKLAAKALPFVAGATSGATQGGGLAALQGANNGHIDPWDVAAQTLMGMGIGGVGGHVLGNRHKGYVDGEFENLGPVAHNVPPEHVNILPPPSPKLLTEAAPPSGHSTVTVHPETIGKRLRLNAAPDTSSPIPQGGEMRQLNPAPTGKRMQLNAAPEQSQSIQVGGRHPGNAPLALPEPIEAKARRVLAERGHTPEQVEAIIQNAKQKRPQLFLAESNPIQVPPGGFKPAPVPDTSYQTGQRPSLPYNPHIMPDKMFLNPETGKGWTTGSGLNKVPPEVKAQLKTQHPEYDFIETGIGDYNSKGVYPQGYGLKAVPKTRKPIAPPVIEETIPQVKPQPTHEDQIAALITRLDRLESNLADASINPRKHKVAIEQMTKDHADTMSQLEKLMYPVEGEQSRPFSTSARSLLSDESGQATMGAALNPVGNVAKGAGKAIVTGDQLVDRILRKAIGRVTESAASGINKVAGKEVIHGGVDPVTGEDRMGQDLADAYDFIRRDVGKGTPALDWYRQRFMNDYGLDPTFVEARNASQHTKRMIQQEGKAIAETLRGKLSPEQEARLYEVLNDRTATHTEMSGTSEPIRQRVNEISKEMRDVGSLTANQHNANEGQYLKRLYEKHLNEMPAISQWAKGFSKTMKGSKYRGKKEAFSPQQLEVRNQAWKEVGQEPDGRLRLSSGEKEILVSQKKAGDFLGNWSQLGTPKGDGKVTAWRDWTPSERSAMGERRVASDAIEATFNQASRDIANGTLLRDVSKNPAWAIKAGEGVEAPEGWVHLGNEKHAGGAPKWGHLNDHWVEPNIARDLQAAKSAAENHREWKAMIAEWKKNKTSRNVKSHVNNAVQNVITLEMNGGSVHDLPEALNAMRNQDGLYKELNDAGLFDGNFSHTELANAVEWHGDSPIQIAQSIGNAVAKLDKKMGEAYRSADDIFRVAYVIGKTKEGLPVQEAVKQAKTRLYHAGVTAPWVRAAGQYGVIPFMSQIHWAAAEVPKMILRNPGKVAKLAMYVGLYKAMANYFNKESKEEQDAKQELMPEYLKGPFNTLPVPFKDSKGQELILNTKNWNPGGTFDLSDRTAVPGWAQSLMPSGPVAIPFNLMLNRDGLTMRDITKKKDAMGKLGDVVPWMADQLGPTTTAHDIGNLINAMRGRADASGRRYDVGTALANVAGIKLQPFDPEMAYRKMQGRYSAELSQIQGDMYAANRKRQQGTISEQEFQNILQQKQAEYQALSREMQQEMQKAQPALK